MRDNEAFSKELEQAEKNLYTRRKFVGLAGTAAAALGLGTFLAGCSDGSGSGEGGAAGEGGSGAAADIDYSDWNAVLEAAKGQTVSWYGYGGDEVRNSWIKNTLAPALKEKYDVTLELVGMDINDILTQLSGEMQTGVAEGTIDFIWINGENFFSTKENGYLWGPFTSYLPNFNDYIDAQSPEVLYDFGSATEGYECPYGKAQMQMWVDSAKVDEGTLPKTPEEFLAFCQAHPGQVTYPEPGDFTGTAFISCLIAGVVGQEEFEKLSMMSAEDATEEAVREIVGPGLEYLRSLNPYLWKGGATFPADSATVGTMYADGELVMNVGYGAPEALVAQGAPARDHAFVPVRHGHGGQFQLHGHRGERAAQGGGARRHQRGRLARDAASTSSSEMAQMSVLDMSRLSEEQRTGFESVPLGVTQIPLDDF